MIDRQQIAMRLAHYIERIVIKETVPKKTGQLARSIVVLTAQNFGAIVGTNKKYAAMVHFGTAGLPGGVLRPKNKKALYWRGAAHPVKKVFQKGNPYFSKAVEIAQNRFRSDAASVFPDLPADVRNEIESRLAAIPGLSVRKV